MNPLMPSPVVERRTAASPEDVWGVLADGWLYPTWVPGASRMRDVEAAWPDVGARLHHSVGLWPALIDDTTEVTESEPPRRMVLRARGWPAGEAWVAIELVPDGTGTLVRIEEGVARGPAQLVPPPARRWAIRWRNTETLRRLCYLAEGRASDVHGTSAR